MLKNIVFLIDDIVCARRAAEFTAELARTYGSKVTVLNAYKPAPKSSFSTYFLALGSDKATHKARNMVNEIVTHFNQLGVENVNGETRVGPRRKVIEEAVASLKPDLIVVGTCGELFSAGRNFDRAKFHATRHESAPLLIV